MSLGRDPAVARHPEVRLVDLVGHVVLLHRVVAGVGPLPRHRAAAGEAGHARDVERSHVQLLVGPDQRALDDAEASLRCQIPGCVGGLAHSGVPSVKTWFRGRGHGISASERPTPTRTSGGPPARAEGLRSAQPLHERGHPAPGLGLVEVQVLEDRVAVRPGLGRREHRRRRTGPRSGRRRRGARQAVPAPGRSSISSNRGVVPAQERGEQGADPGQLAVVGGAREELVDRVDDLVAGAAARARRARDRHRHPGQHQRLGEHDEELLALDRVRGGAAPPRRPCARRRRPGRRPARPAPGGPAASPRSRRGC